MEFSWKLTFFSKKPWLIQNLSVTLRLNSNKRKNIILKTIS